MGRAGNLLVIQASKPLLTCSLSRQNLESYQNQHKAGNFAIEVDKSLKRKRRASLQDFADKIKLGHENYSPNVPASVHGAPQNEEVSTNMA